MTLIFFLIILLALVLSHEFGHFFAARAFGIKVEEFGFGIPPRIAGIWRDKKGTLYSLNFLPFGGFVKIFGEEGDGSDQPGSFGSKPAWSKALVLASGVLANILLAYMIFSFVSWAGAPQVISEEERSFYQDAKITIIDLAPASPAAMASIKVGDQVVGFSKIENFQNFVRENQGQNINVSLLRGKETLAITVLARANPPEGEGPLGIALGYVRIKKSPWYLAPIDGARLAWQTLESTVLGFFEIVKNIARKETANIQVAGPVGIFNITSSAVSMGLNTILILTAILSINLAVINVLPFPGLDGGRLFFLLIEAIRGKRISPKIGAFTHSLGLAILIILMILITYHDIAKTF
ncbi:hypothetical protein A3G55_03550 [Candidatus Giovannonibacteria bacterium RIFCSPLOWO2_12_FULL_44_25]|uniref:Peptidase M50 domain-containing protein n=2 Tax=Candidatus Giovannoniibacteriota TaxID=1752738 RepID=A0A1F5WBN2_9BACT|nr:MAG: Membrane-associated zinc metalloprotease [Parcubacteria group bacterium GW2011_GWC1_44_10]KKT59740.1 MAG: Membrane-associated zinc metalloprotease [Candidatus Giovannonibacteria bacterium GW2011_GWA1_44_25]KKU29618.1 MAG: Membrane-associated zinc metalloprotease [Candidatus Giovannonibacteria bacterium GW2011_GWB1_46_20]OGF50327.1 MAG: hypothetical protein A2120_02020 [Candidatus Giovannonibacteria bacterium GWA2_45_15]OGF60133.1 MAG: hypothetical protein A2W40_00885 [Candidatus Giovann